MNRKQKQFVSIWTCLACEACNSANAEIIAGLASLVRLSQRAVATRSPPSARSR